MDNSFAFEKRYEEFESQHAHLVAGLEGIADLKERRWYATVLLGRLILIYLLQRRGFIGDGDEWYLQNKLGQSQQRGAHQFYTQFLQVLFFQGFCLPTNERPAEVTRLLGQVPYLGSSLFWPHWLEEQYPDLKIGDRVFEGLLSWLSENPWHLSETPLPEQQPAAIDLRQLAQMFEQFWQAQQFNRFYLQPEVWAALWQRSLSGFIVQQVNQQLQTTFTTLADLRNGLNEPVCEYLVQGILPQLSVLDPACGTGSGLLVALQLLVEIYQPVVTYAQKTRSPQLKTWVKTWGLDLATSAYSLKKWLLSQCLYGIDRSELAVEIARLQLLLSLMASAPTVSAIEPLPHLDFNIAAGDALVGFVSVDEAGFDEIPPLSSGRRRRSPVALQGNLLQPLAAETYRMILAEKNISLEHYRDQTSLMAEVGSVPRYVQAEFLRDRIDELNQQAQAKLNQLLLNDFSQKHGIQYRFSQGKWQKRLLNQADMAVLNPIHWGFQFQQILSRQGGFAVILGHPPWGAIGPTAESFCQEYATLLAQEQISPPDFLKQKKPYLDNQAIATAWQQYESRFGYVNEYLRVSEQYRHQNVGKSFRKRLSQELLYLERCCDLLRPDGFCTLLLPAHMPHEADAQPVLKALLQQTQLDPIVIYRNDPAWFVGLKPTFQFCLLTFQKGGSTAQVTVIDQRG